MPITSYIAARNAYTAAIKASIIADGKGFGPDMESAWAKVEEARSLLAAAAEAVRATGVDPMEAWGGT